MQLLTFLLNGVKFGIPVNDVESIETRMNVVNIPNSLPQVHGIMNLHGEVIAVCTVWPTSFIIRNRKSTISSLHP